MTMGSSHIEAAARAACILASADDKASMVKRVAMPASVLSMPSMAMEIKWDPEIGDFGTRHSKAHLNAQVSCIASEIFRLGGGLCCAARCAICCGVRRTALDSLDPGTRLVCPVRRTLCITPRIVERGLEGPPPFPACPAFGRARAWVPTTSENPKLTPTRPTGIIAEACVAVVAMTKQPSTLVVVFGVRTRTHRTAIQALIPRTPYCAIRRLVIWRRRRYTPLSLRFSAKDSCLHAHWCSATLGPKRRMHHFALKFAHFWPNNFPRNNPMRPLPPRPSMTSFPSASIV